MPFAASRFDPAEYETVISMIRTLLTLVSRGLLCVGLAGTLAAQSASHPISGQPVVLFDGQSTHGWTKANGQPHDGWVVQDGALWRQSGGGDLYHEGTWRDFVLYFQWKISKGGNSGLKYRVKQYDNAWLGCEYQILDDQNAVERNKAASLYDIFAPVAHKPVAGPDVWHQGMIVVCGNRLEHWLDGVLVMQTQVGSEQWEQQVAKSKFRDRPQFGANRQGRIFLQDHGNPVWFRQIVLVPLKCDAGLAGEGLPGFPPGNHQPVGNVGIPQHCVVTPPAACDGLPTGDFAGPCRPRFHDRGRPPQRTLFLRRRWSK